MRRISKMIVALALLLSTPLFADGVPNKTFGLGLYAGEPFGLSSRYYLNPNMAIDTTLGFGFVGERSFVATPSFLLTGRDILTLDQPNFSLVPYLGMGMKFGVDTLGFGNRAIVAMRMPFGASFVLADGLWEVNLEWSHGVRFTTFTGYDWGWGIGVRYYFW